MQTQTAVNAVNNVNAARQREVERQAEVLVLEIRDEQKNITALKVSLAESQESLKKLVDFTVDNIYGNTLPTGNANAGVITEVIAKQQKAQVEGPASKLACGISERLNGIKKCEERITEARKKLSELVAQSVSVEEIVGA